MDFKEIENILLREYNLKSLSIEKVKNVFHIKTFNEEYCLKVVKYEKKHFLFILGAIKHLINNNFNNVTAIIPTNSDCDYIKLGNNYAYLTKWIQGRLCDYQNEEDLKLATIKLAKLHKSSRDFNISLNMKPRIGWFKWIQTFSTRRDEILDFKKRIENKATKSEFDYLYLNMMEEELERAQKSIYDLGESDYINLMKEEIKLKGFCHHDYAHHNILIENNKHITIIDFDYCLLDTHLHDLSSILIRSMKNGNWRLETSKVILDAYNSEYKVNSIDIPIMAAFMEFPQDYWQRGIQYYWEKQPWGEEFFVRKLKKIYEDREQKQEFIEEFKVFNYKG